MNSLAKAMQAAGIERPTLTLKKPSTRVFPRLEPTQTDIERREALKREKRMNACTRWIRKFPVFQMHPLPPLKVSIHKDINAIRKQQGQPFGARHVGEVLKGMLSAGGYRKRLVIDATRLDLDGVPCGVVEVIKKAPRKGPSTRSNPPMKEDLHETG